MNDPRAFLIAQEKIIASSAEGGGKICPERNTLQVGEESRVLLHGASLVVGGGGLFGERAFRFERTWFS